MLPVAYRHSKMAKKRLRSKEKAITIVLLLRMKEVFFAKRTAAKVSGMKLNGFQYALAI
jgi:hypothetical protein